MGKKRGNKKVRNANYETITMPKHMAAEIIQTYNDKYSNTSDLEIKTFSGGNIYMNVFRAQEPLRTAMMSLSGEVGEKVFSAIRSSRKNNISTISSQEARKRIEAAKKKNNSTGNI